MTDLLATVRDIPEVVTACEANAHIVDLSSNTSAAASIANGEFRAPRNSSLLSVCLEDGPLSRSSVSGFDVIRFDPNNRCAPQPTPGVERIAVLSDLDRAISYAANAGASCSEGVMLDTSEQGPLLECLDLVSLSKLTEACRQGGLRSFLGGRLEAPDVDRLLLINPDVLSFDGGLRSAGMLDGARLKEALNLLGSCVHLDHKMDGPVDVVFVHDLVMPAQIGAYKREEEKTQSIRINVDASVVRTAKCIRDMNDVFSYDIITEKIKILAANGHVLFVESFADELCESLLRYSRVQRVTVRVEKLDVLPGSVGVQITRDKSAIREPRNSK